MSDEEDEGGVPREWISACGDLMVEVNRPEPRPARLLELLSAVNTLEVPDADYDTLLASGVVENLACGVRKGLRLRLHSTVDPDGQYEVLRDAKRQLWDLLRKSPESMEEIYARMDDVGYLAHCIFEGNSIRLTETWVHN